MKGDDEYHTDWRHDLIWHHLVNKVPNEGTFRPKPIVIPGRREKMLEAHRKAQAPKTAAANPDVVATTDDTTTEAATETGDGTESETETETEPDTQVTPVASTTE